MLRPPSVRCFLLVLVFFAAGGALAAFEDDFAATPAGQDPRWAEESDGTRTERPVIRAERLAPGETVALDGRLDDPIWQRAVLGWGFQQHEPERFVPPSVPTTFKVAYDADAVYFAVACWENDMADVASRLSRRDHIETSDLVSIYIDPYHDLTTGYNFRSTIDGVQQDAYLFDNGNRDEDWNAVWEVETWRDDHGWYCEYRIPFRAIRFKPAADMTWGLQIYRWLHGRGQDTGWVTWDRNLNGFVSRWGTMTGLEDVNNPRKLEMLPYVAGGLSDPADPNDDNEEWDRYFNWGADFKYNLTSDLTLNATFQPDFGQVEADPAVLNLSPFETFYQEKRPFFIEGSRFFSHPDFNLFYSRRIGTGDVNSRIRTAAKLTGKLAGSTTIAALGAFTDVAPEGRAHNPFVSGHEETGFGIVRLGQDFNEGNQQVHVMAGGVWRPDDTGFANETAYSGGLDFDLYFVDRAYNLQGSLVGSSTQTGPGADATTGTGGSLEFEKEAGTVRGGIGGRWESDTLELNDLGFLNANDEISTALWTQLRYDGDGQPNAWANHSYLYLQGRQSWLYGESTRLADDEQNVLWSYDSGHPQGAGTYLSWWTQTRGFWNFELEWEHNFRGTSKYNTRFFEGRRGPLMRTAASDWFELGMDSDWRRDVSYSAGVEYAASEVGGRLWGAGVGTRVNLGRHFVGRLSANYRDLREDAQWLDNFADPQQGLGDVAYVFGFLDQQTLDMTIRASYLFERDLSLELYLQPFVSAGNYSQPRYLAEPDTRDLRPYRGVDAANYDFRTSSLNANLVLRWEYRPGSTIFLVYTHGRYIFDERQDYEQPRDFVGGLRPGSVFDTEGTNTILVKVNYWFSI